MWGWFRMSDLQHRKLVFASVAVLWGRNVGKLKFTVILSWGFGPTHALRAKTSSILKISVLWPDWRYAKSHGRFYYSFAYTQSDLLDVCYHVPATRQNSTNDKSFKSALFVGAGRENMTPGQTLSSCRKDVTPRIKRAGLNQAEQAVCPCGVTVLGGFRARIGCSHSERALGETPLIYKVQTSQGKGIMKPQPYARERRVYLIALIRSAPSRFSYACVLCPMLPERARIRPFYVTCSGVSLLLISSEKCWFLLPRCKHPNCALRPTEWVSPNQTPPAQAFREDGHTLVTEYSW